jgi:dolichyl-phosphate beta-glucosyltransferase
MLDLSVIIPAYNEERRLPSTLASVFNFLHESGRSFEIIVVDDGSMDHTIEIVEEFATHNKQDGKDVRLIAYSPNQGKGYAVRSGMLAARGEYLLIDDADGASPIEEVSRLEDAIANGADIAIGSRAKPDTSRMVKAKFSRKFIGNTFNVIVQTLLLPGFFDTQCGFKLFKRDTAIDLFSSNRIDGFAFDVEVLYIAKLRGYKIAEVPINWTNVTGSKVHVLIDSPIMLWEVLTVAVAAAFGRYKRQASSSSSR